MLCFALTSFCKTFYSNVSNISDISNSTKRSPQLAYFTQSIGLHAASTLPVVSASSLVRQFAVGCPLFVLRWFSSRWYLSHAPAIQGPPGTRNQYTCIGPTPHLIFQNKATSITTLRSWKAAEPSNQSLPNQVTTCRCCAGVRAIVELRFICPVGLHSETVRRFVLQSDAAGMW